MKKLIALLLVAMLVLAMTACGTVNKTEVAVLWSGEGVAKTPNSMINAMERAMYMKNVAYRHYGAQGDSQTQMEQAKQALDAGCAGLAVELAPGVSSDELVAMAKEKNVPIVFFNLEWVDGATTERYESCVAVASDAASIETALVKMVEEALEDEKTFAKMDRNGDGKISCMTVGAKTIPLNEKVQQQLLETLDYEVGNSDLELTLDGDLVLCGAENVEMVITDSDLWALKFLQILQTLGFNTDKLETHCIPIYTVGAQEDAREFANTEGLEAEEVENMIYTAENLVSDGKLAGVVLQDYDSAAVSVATVLRNAFTGKDQFKGVEGIADGIQIAERVVSIPYVPYEG